MRIQIKKKKYWLIHHKGGNKSTLCLQQDYIGKVPVIFSDNIHSESQKPFDPPTWVT